MPRFVILEHRWNGVHWDLMLEAEGVLRTWALADPIVADRDLRARALPDHRLHYLDYEGPISGDRGSVHRLDQGTYQLQSETSDRVEVRLVGAQIEGTVVLFKLETGSGDASWEWRFRFGKRD